MPKGSRTATILAGPFDPVSNAWDEVERIGERIIEAQKAERGAWELYAANPTEALLERWRATRDELGRLMNERDKLLRETAS